MASARSSSVSKKTETECPAVRLENVVVKYGDKLILNQISLEVPSGQSVVLIGPSGAGKSTLLGVLNGTVVPASGSVWIGDKNLNRLSPHERRRVCSQIGTVYQDLCLVDSLRVVHNVNAGNLGRWSTLRSVCSLMWPLERSRAQAALERVGIPEKIYEKTATLSGGQQQRVAIARVLVQDPSVILADEPISSLDPERSRGTMDLLRQLNRDLAKTVITSCHSIEFARSHFDAVIGLRHGEVRFVCDPEELTHELLQDLYRLESGIVAHGRDADEDPISASA